MARPTKQGIDYFPLDTQFDDKIELYIVENGAVSLSVLVTVWQLIYSNEGYYINYSEDLMLLIKRRLLLPVQDIRKVLEAAVKRNIFSKSLFSSHKILTSKAIQKRFFTASRKKKTVKAVRNYMCKGVSDVENSNIMWVNVAGNATKEKEKEKEDTDETKTYHSIASRLRDIVLLRRKKKITEGTLVTWSKTIRLLIEKDERTEIDVTTSLEWYEKHWNDDFVPVIESAKALREKFDSLLNAIQRGGDISPGGFDCSICDYKLRGDCPGDRSECSSFTKGVAL